VRREDIDLVLTATGEREEPNPEYVQLLGQLITKTLPEEYEGSAFVDDYRLSLAEAIAASATGGIARRLVPEVAREDVPDLLAALKASIDAAPSAPPKGRATKKAAPKAAARKTPARKTAPARKKSPATALTGRRGRKAA
jgi:DNA end-binding protein Ku